MAQQGRRSRPTAGALQNTQNRLGAQAATMVADNRPAWLTARHAATHVQDMKPQPVRGPLSGCCAV